MKISGRGIGVCIFVLLILLVLFTMSVAAHEVVQGTVFHVPNSSCDYHMANNFSIANITIYSTALYFDDGNITTYPSTGYINMSLEGLETSIYFTNNVTVANLTIDNGFASFTIINGETYDIRYQSNDAIFQEVTAAWDKIIFTNIPSGSWQIYITPTMKEILIGKHVQTTETSYALLGILGIVFLVVFILYILFALQSGTEINFTAILIGFVMLIGFFILLYVMLPLFDVIINAMNG